MLMRCVEIESEPYGKANYYKEAAYLIKAEGTDANKFVRLANEAIELYSIAGRSGGAAECEFPGGGGRGLQYCGGRGGRE